MISSSLVIRGECKICYEHRLELELFQVFPCGHCFCQNCIHRLFSTNGRRVKCPLCRETWLRTDASQLVFDPVIVNLADYYTDYVIDGLNRMDTTCKSISVKLAHAKLAKAAESIQQDNAERLQNAIEDFSQRIIPLFEELELGRQKIQKLEEDQHTKSQHLTAKSRKVDALEREVSHLQRSKAELEKNLSESSDSVKAFRVRIEELQGNVARAWMQISLKEEQLNRAIDSLNRFKASDVLKTKKLKVIKQEVENLSAKLQEKEGRASELNNMMDLDQDLLDTGAVAQSSTLSSLHRHSEEDGWTTVDNNFRFEGVPGPSFKSAWNNGGTVGKKPNILLKKSQPNCTKVNSNFPLNLDAKGRPTAAVQVGPKSTIRVTQRF